MSAREHLEQEMAEWPSGLTLSSTAIFTAWIAHEGQVDKAGADYYDAHVLDVVNRLNGAPSEVRLVAYLHDVLEDSDITEEQLQRRFPADVVDAVVAITHLPNEPRSDYYARVRSNPIALRVKLADIASNTDPERMALLDEPTRERLTRKYAAALEALA